MNQYSKLLALALVVVAVVVVWMTFRYRRGSGTDTATPTTNTTPTVTSPETEPGRPAKATKHGFQDIARESGIDFRMIFLPGEQGEKFKINLYDHGCGVVVGDYDGDGLDDIYFLNQLGPNALYKNNGNGTFTDVTKEAGVGLGDRICVGGTFGDYDNDGDQDLYVTSTRGGNVLFQNEGNGRFRNVTQEAGLALVAHSQTAAFFDADNDGYLDLFVTNSAQWTTNEFDEASKYFVGPPGIFDLVASPKEFNILYHNNRDGTFSDVTEEAGLKGDGWAGDVAIADLDDDGDLDLFVTNMFGIGRLYRNESNGRFHEVAKQTFGRTSWGMVGAKIFDFNNDGKLDLFITDMHSDMWMPPANNEQLRNMILQIERRKYNYVTGPSSEFDDKAMDLEKNFADKVRLHYEDVIFGNTLFKNLGEWKFEEISDKANIETFWPWGIATGDFDNDGYEDVYIPSGMGYPYFYWRSYLMMNNGDETFVEQSEMRGIEPPAKGRFLEQKIGSSLAARSSRCAATGDFDGDGRLDIIVNNFNDYPYYYKNTFPPKNYVAFRLKGTRSNWDAIGAVVKIHLGEEVLTRQVQAAGGYLSQSSKTIHFGLGDRSMIDRVDIRWPSGTLQTMSSPRVNMLHPITEPEE